jgi:hypothetical protein
MAWSRRACRAHVIDRLPASHAAYLTGHTFFPSLISAPLEHGLAIAFDFAIAACLVAAVASLLRGRKYIHGVDPEPAALPRRATLREPDAMPAPAAVREPAAVHARAAVHEPATLPGRADLREPVRGL